MSRRVRRRSPVSRAVTIGAAVVAVDLTTKMIAVALLGSRTIPLPGGSFLEVVYNDAFARGLHLGEWSLAATVLLAAMLIWLLVRVCGELAEIDGGAPIALGLIGGATAANATDFARTGRGVVDFLGVGGDTGIVFNLADVAAYMGVALLARTGLRLAGAVAAERALAGRQVELALDAAFDATVATQQAASVAPAPAAAPPRGIRPSRRRPAAAPLEMPHGIPVFRDGVAADGEHPATDGSVVLRFPSSIESPVRPGRVADGETELR